MKPVTLSAIKYRTIPLSEADIAILVDEWQAVVEGLGTFFITNTDMKFYLCHDESGEIVITSDSLDGIVTWLAERDVPNII